MTAVADLAPYGTHLPDAPVRTVMAITRRLPANWLGLRMSMPLRRLAIDWLGNRPVDTTLWDARVRLYPSRNGCEKSALFTPQLFDMQELGFLGAALDRRLAEGGAFTFVDVGANVGIYSIFVAARGGDRARCLAIEPQPGIVDRARFNFAANPALKIEIIPMAIADHDGSVDMIINRRDSGGSHIRSGSAAAKDAELVRVPCRPLGAMLAEAGISTIDAIKIDIEGAEHLALAPLLNEAPRDLLPRLVLIEDRPSDWPVDLYAALAQRGYSRLGRGKVNMLFSLP